MPKKAQIEPTEKPQKSKKMGRPKTRNPHWNMIYDLCRERASLDYIATEILRVDGREINRANIVSTIRYIQREIRREWGETFVAFRNKKWTDDVSIRTARSLLKAIDSGIPSVLIFSAKNFLDMADRIETKNENVNKYENGELEKSLQRIYGANIQNVLQPSDKDTARQEQERNRIKATPNGNLSGDSVQGSLQDSYN